MCWRCNPEALTCSSRSSFRREDLWSTSWPDRVDQGALRRRVWWWLKSTPSLRSKDAISVASDLVLASVWVLVWCRERVLRGDDASTFASCITSHQADMRTLLGVSRIISLKTCLKKNILFRSIAYRRLFHILSVFVNDLVTRIDRYNESSKVDTPKY